MFSKSDFWFLAQSTVKIIGVEETCVALALTHTHTQKKTEERDEGELQCNLRPVGVRNSPPTVAHTNCKRVDRNTTQKNTPTGFDR